MRARPAVETNRLILRPFSLADAPEVQQLAGDREIASTTLEIPYPYEDGVAEEWINTHQEKYERGELVNFAITIRLDGSLIGCISVGLNQPHDNGELGFWIGKPYWNQGYCTEAAEAVLRYAFAVMGLNRVYAHHFVRNPASGRVLQKIGMNYEGCLRQHTKKWGEFEDLAQYGLVKSDYELQNRNVRSNP